MKDLQVLDFTRLFTALVNKSISKASPFFVYLAFFCISYTHMQLLFIKTTDDEQQTDEIGETSHHNNGIEAFLKRSYLLALAEFGDEVERFPSYGFTVFIWFTLIITLVLMNLIIAIISDRYEEIIAMQSAEEGRIKLERTMEVERLLMLFRCKKKKQTYFYLFAREPLHIAEQEEPESQWEGMVG